MTNRQTRQREVFVRTGEFQADYGEQFPDGSAGSMAFGAVATAVAQIDAADEAKQATKEGGRIVKKAAKEALSQHLLKIRKTAKLMALNRPGADSGFQPPASYSDAAVRTAARTFLKEAAPLSAVFVEYGLPSTFLQDLQSALDAFAERVDSRSTRKVRMFDARHTIRTAIEDGNAALRMLDVIVANVLANDRKALDRWKVARHLEGARRGGEVVPFPAASSPATPPAAPVS